MVQREHLSESPEGRRFAFWTGIMTRPLTADLPPEVTRILKEGDHFDYRLPSNQEVLIVTAELTTPRQAVNLTQNGFFGAIEAGLIPDDRSVEAYNAFAMRPIVTVYSEPHGSQIFAYDAETGQRFWPRGDVSHLDGKTFARQAAVMELLTDRGRSGTVLRETVATV